MNWMLTSKQQNMLKPKDLKVVLWCHKTTNKMKKLRLKLHRPARTPPPIVTFHRLKKGKVMRLPVRRPHTCQANYPSPLSPLQPPPPWLTVAMVIRHSAVPSGYGWRELIEARLTVIASVYWNRFLYEKIYLYISVRSFSRQRWSEKKSFVPW